MVKIKGLLFFVVSGGFRVEVVVKAIACLIPNKRLRRLVRRLY